MNETRCGFGQVVCCEKCDVVNCQLSHPRGVRYDWPSSYVTAGNCFRLYVEKHVYI